MTEHPISAATRARGSSFYAAMRIMPRAQREAMFEIYGFCRAVDDIADEPLPHEVRIDQMRRWRAEIDAIYSGSHAPHTRGLARAVQTFDLPRVDFLAVIDGMEMDVVSTIRAPDLATLDLYCDRVASAVGRLSVRVFQMEKQAGFALAYHLGRALQLTNILRDLDEDAALGRLYLPKEAMLEANITTSEPLAALSSPNIGRACAFVVALADRHFTEADAVMAKSPRWTVRTPRVMAAAYRLLLARMVERGWQAPRERVKLKRRQLFRILLQYAFV
jgi:presqualene diphosphate synthase